jgi:hypothetical protein
MASTRLEDRVRRAAEAALAEQCYVSAVDVLLRRAYHADSALAAEAQLCALAAFLPARPAVIKDLSRPPTQAHRRGASATAPSSAPGSTSRPRRS